MDKQFIAHSDYLKNKANTSCVLLRSCLEGTVKRRFDTLEYIDEMPPPDAFTSFDENTIPIGDLNWVRTWLSHVPNAQDPTLSPIEIPDVMLPFVGREYFWSFGKDIDAAHMDASKYFIKDIDTLKNWNSNVYEWDVSEYILPDTMYSISEKVNFLSEWRVFVFEDVEQGAFNYLGDAMLFPNRDTIHEMISAWKSDVLSPRPRAYTLDVGVIYKPDDKCSDEKGHITVPIEVHPFVACGLYGFCDAPVIADMLVAGYEWYRDEAGNELLSEDIED